MSECVCLLALVLFPIINLKLIQRQRQTFVSTRLCHTHSEKKHLLTQATTPKPPTHRLPSLSPVFPLTFPPTALCCKYKTQAANCKQRLPWIRSQHTHTLSKPLTQ